MNYYYQNNSLGITPAEIGEIKSTYVDKLNVWKNFVENNKFIEIKPYDYKCDVWSLGILLFEPFPASS